MKKILFISLFLISLSAFAHGPRHGGYYRPGGYYGGNWVAPLIIGGVIGYAARPYVAPQPTYVQPYVQQLQPVGNIVIINGITYREESQYFVDCNCYKTVLIQQ